MLNLGPKKLCGALADLEMAGSKNFWHNLGKAFGPLQAIQENFWFMLNHGWKSAVQYPLNRKIKSPKMPPLGLKRVFFISGYLRVMYCPPWPSLVQIWQPPSVRSVSLRAGIPVKPLLLNMCCNFDLETRRSTVIKTCWIKYYPFQKKIIQGSKHFCTV